MRTALASSLRAGVGAAFSSYSYVEMASTEALVSCGFGLDRRELMRAIIVTCYFVSYVAIKTNHVLYRRSEEHTSELQSRFDLVCRLLLEKKNNKKIFDKSNTLFRY